MDGKLVVATANEILKYLQRYPHSADAAHAIHTFWINWGCSPEQLPITEAALCHLRSAGLMERVESDTEVLWRLSANGLRRQAWRARNWCAHLP